jgi:hypothetical protein
VANVEGRPSLKRAGTAWILTVGVNRYANAGFKLNYAVADAESFAAELARAQGILGTYERVRTVVLSDDEATKANVLSALRRLAGENVGTPAKQLPAATPTTLALFSTRTIIPVQTSKAFSSPRRRSSIANVISVPPHGSQRSRNRPQKRRYFAWRRCHAPV